eukprot:CAMPEP_0197869276 /NCGR_PEP_ID=MMETSP1439-20131203/118_1 /TAXON_ID=66791 /ORGANISM="Gonyaulax spinifera, Strain CCMP409" /LENGTH=74 /DNA_ID=CAMNT_0043488061 /DNA_START=14 /DNA_END=236 /DNA_ORIENTATION=+
MSSSRSVELDALPGDQQAITALRKLRAEELIIGGDDVLVTADLAVSEPQLEAPLVIAAARQTAEGIPTVRQGEP